MTKQIPYRCFPLETVQMKLRDFYWVYTPWASFLGALGGWAIKPLRRIVLPLSGMLLAAAYGIPLWRCLCYFFSTAIAFSLGYSPDRNSLLHIAAVGYLYGVTPLFLLEGTPINWITAKRVYRDYTDFVVCLILWPVLSALVMAGMFWMSLERGLPWKLVEITVFGLHGFLVSFAIHEKQ